MSRFGFVALFLVAACATPAIDEASKAAPSNGSLGTTDGPDPRPLANYNIPPGRCGMILWTKDGGRIAPIFRSIDTVEATMIIEGDEVPLVLASQDGDQRFGMRARQVFTPTNPENGSTVVETNIEWGSGFPSGTYVSGGSLKLTAEDGWQRILPVAGIAGCKA